MVGAGNGLFARRDIDEDEVICMYSGELKDVDKSNDSDYIVDVKVTTKGVEEEKYLDAVALDNTAGRYINDARKSNYENNARYDEVVHYHSLIKKHYVRVIATRPIPKDSEIFNDYGKHYWKGA